MEKCFIRVVEHHHKRELGASSAFDDTCQHEVRSHTDGHRAVLILHANRSMRPGAAARRGCRP